MTSVRCSRSRGPSAMKLSAAEAGASAAAGSTRAWRRGRRKNPGPAANQCCSWCRPRPLSQRTLRRGAVPDHGCRGLRGLDRLRPAKESRRKESSQTHLRLEIAAYSAVQASERILPYHSRAAWRASPVYCLPLSEIGLQLQCWVMRYFSRDVRSLLTLGSTLRLTISGFCSCSTPPYTDGCSDCGRRSVRIRLWNHQ